MERFFAALLLLAISAPSRALISQCKTTLLYVSSAGSGTACSSGTPCQFSGAWTNLTTTPANQPGAIIIAADGTYQGANNMIQPTATAAATATATAGSYTLTSVAPTTAFANADPIQMLDSTGRRYGLPLAAKVSSGGGTATLTLDSPSAITDSVVIFNPAGNITGKPGCDVTVVTANKGAVLIDGQAARTPLLLPVGANHITVRGFNFAHGNQNVVNVAGSWTTLQEILAWDAAIDVNNSIIQYANPAAVNNLLEDYGTFGTGRRNVGKISTNGPNTDRRGWNRFQSSTDSSPKEGYSPGYHDDTFNTTSENIIVTLDQSYMPSSYVVQCGGNCASPPLTCTGGVQGGGVCTMSGGTVFNPYSPFTRFSGPLPAKNDKFLGILLYQKSGQAFQDFGQLSFVSLVDSTTAKDIIGYYPVDAAFSGMTTLLFAGGTNHTGDSALNFTSFKGSSLGYFDGSTHGNIHTDWCGGSACSASNHNIVEATTPAALYTGGCVGKTIYTVVPADQCGAGLRFNYVNGVLMDGTGGKPLQPLWPWKMGSRIVAALTSAGYAVEDLNSPTGWRVTTFGKSPDEP